MTGLCASGDIVLPNITEASLMTGLPYRETYDQAYIDGLLDALASLGMQTVILKGVSLEPGVTGVIVADGKERKLYRHRKIERSCHGTGDVFASAFVGSLLRASRCLTRRASPRTTPSPALKGRWMIPSTGME
jgi:pyridoxine kinase